MEHSPAVRQQIMVVEDNELIVEFVEQALLDEHFDVIVAEGCAEALELLEEHHPDLIVLDIVLTDGTGYELCRAIRSGGEDGSLRGLADVPILMLTARADEQDRIEGFVAGADDYLTKPFNVAELIYRIRAILRRSRGVSHALLEIGQLRIDPFKREVSAGDQPIALTRKEFDLLHLLASKPGQVFTREELLERVWDYSYAGNTRTVDVHVNRLRQKLLLHPTDFEMISTEWGVGYKLCPFPEMKEKAV